MSKKQPTDKTPFVLSPELESKCQKAEELHLKLQEAKNASKKSMLDVLIEGRTMLEIEAEVPWGSFDDVCADKMPHIPLRNVRSYASKARKLFGASRGEPYTLQDARDRKIALDVWTDERLAELCKPGLRWKDVAEIIAVDNNHPGYGQTHFGRPGPTLKNQWKKAGDKFGELPEDERQAAGDSILADMVNKGYHLTPTPVDTATVEGMWENVKGLLQGLPTDDQKTKGSAIVTALTEMGIAPATTAPIPVDPPTIDESWQTVKKLIESLPADDLQTKGQAILADLVALGFALKAVRRSRDAQTQEHAPKLF